MKFESMSGKDRSRRNKSSVAAPAIIESLEMRSLLTVISPTGTINNATPQIAWDAVDNAVSYDLWVSDVEQRTLQFVKSNIADTNYTPLTPLNVGNTRAWVRANFGDGSKSNWSAPRDFVVQVVPVVTGPVNATLPATQQKLSETKPTITWTSPPGASRFEIFFSDQTKLTSKVIPVNNLTPLLDVDGKTTPDGKGDVLRQEIRAYTFTEDLPMGSYRVFVRTFDDGGRVTAWSPGFNFEVATPVTITRPSAPTFENPPLLEWQAISGATHYEVFVAKSATPNVPLIPVVIQTGTSYQMPKKLDIGSYTFFVRARLRTTGRPETTGIWSAPSTFSTITNPVITGPAGIPSNDPTMGTVTDLRPTIEWTPIDKAARYDIWVELSNGTKPYLQTTSSTNSYRFEQGIAAGKYSVWVRAVSTTGVLTGWSPEYKFTATGGVPVITSPTQNDNVVPIPDFRWTAVAEAKSYDVWIAWVGEDFDYIRTSGVTLTSFAPTDPLPPGTYRFWVRAVKSDGAALGWSTAVTFTVASSDVAPSTIEMPELLSAILPTRVDVHQESVPNATSQQTNMPSGDSAEFSEEDREFTEAVVVGTPAPVSVATSQADALIEQLAEQCISQEWWTPENAKT